MGKSYLARNSRQLLVKINEKSSMHAPLEKVSQKLQLKKYTRKVLTFIT